MFMDVVTMLDELQGKALHDAEVRNRFLNTKKSLEPITEFCKVCQELGYELYEMDLICAGEEFHAAMKRSTNGGGENSPMLSGEDDFYELFMASITERKNTDFIIIGASILDVLAQPVTTDVFQTGSVSASHVAIHTGGDALNEATVLAALGSNVRLVSKTGTDYAGKYIQTHCRQSKIDTTFLLEEESLETGVNLVLVDDSGERHFITSQNGSLRKLSPKDISDQALLGGRYLCFASIFVFPTFDDNALTQLFSKSKAKGLILCADMTKCKHGETLEDIKNCLSLLDYIFPNYEEASLLTGLTDWDEVADAFLGCGVGCVVLKAGARGCFIKTKTERYWIPAYLHACCLDTTGAGDTFTACFLDALDHGMPLPECGAFANAGASICIEQIGAAKGVKNRAQVMERYSHILSSME